MTAAFAPPRLPLLVFTDLDGSLLDHEDYTLAAARPALAQLHHYGIPLVPATSKTLAEMTRLRESLPDRHPFIVENGGILCIPRGYFPKPEDAVTQADYWLLRLAPAYDRVLAVLERLRREQGFRFRGFHDMSVAEIAQDTGLTETGAGQARQRLCSEPLRWEDSAQALTRFTSALGEQELRLTRGGRYWHVLGQADKAAACHRLAELYRYHGAGDFTTLALGDGPNDRGMLAAADIAVVVRRKDGSALDTDPQARCIVTAEPGPAGWNAAVLQVLRELSAVRAPGSDG
jgi:mannosyl-3-phosphoglycerate phosphatase